MTGVTPLFNGVDCFGPVARVAAHVTPPARVTRGFVGVNNLVTKFNGTRGAAAEATGTLFGDTLADQIAAEGVLHNFEAGGAAYVLIDTEGRAWPNMILVAFELGDLIQDVNGYARDYRATFLGLSLPTF